MLLAPGPRWVVQGRRLPRFCAHSPGHSALPSQPKSLWKIRLPFCQCFVGLFLVFWFFFPTNKLKTNSFLSSSGLPATQGRTKLRGQQDPTGLQCGVTAPRLKLGFDGLIMGVGSVLDMLPVVSPTAQHCWGVWGSSEQGPDGGHWLSPFILFSKETHG